MSSSIFFFVKGEVDGHGQFGLWHDIFLEMLFEVCVRAAADNDEVNGDIFWIGIGVFFCQHFGIRRDRAIFPT